MLRNITTVYIQLLNEGTICYRPVPVLQLEGSVFKITGEELYKHVKDDEIWEFAPGTIIIAEQMNLTDGLVFVATKKQSPDS